MPQLFKSVPGDVGSLVFQFNGQFALKNYNVEIVNGNRLKVTSVQNEMFSLLEVDVTEVEINGTIYSDASAAQIALQSLVYSSQLPQILTSLEKAALMAGFKGSVNKTTPAPIEKGFYLAEEAGRYTNLNNLVALEGFFTFFVFTGSTWIKSETKLSQNLDETGGALSFKAAVEMLSGFMEIDNSTPIKSVTIGQTSNIGGGNFLKPNNTYSKDSAYPNAGVVYNFPVGRATKLHIKGLHNLQSGSNYAPIAGRKKDGSAAAIMQWTDGDISGEHLLDVSEYESVSIQTWAGSPWPVLELWEYSTSMRDVKEYIETLLQVLNFFIYPSETKWEDFSMPRPNEISNAIINTGWAQYAAAGTANGRILFSDLPSDVDSIKVKGKFDSAGSGTLWIGVFNDATGVKEQLLKGIGSESEYVFKIDRKKYQGLVYSRIIDNQKFQIGKKIKLPVVEDSVKNYIERLLSGGAAISKEKSAQVKRPSKVIRMDFTTVDTLPIDKNTTASGQIFMTDQEGLNIKKAATLNVQGSSSAAYPKKNWTVALLNDDGSEFKLRVGNWVEHSEFVFKANWIDATHSRNLISNWIWEDIIQSRSGYPKRENEKLYAPGDTIQLGRFESGALCHVDGLPAELYINGAFYGIGTFNLGKKRENYDLSSSNQNHIQIAAETHANFFQYVPTEWDIRNPKTPDANFEGKINAWFAANALTGQAFKDYFQKNHDLKNSIDFYLLAEFICSGDMFVKNLLLTSYDGVKFYFLPYDMDTTFGLHWRGDEWTGWTDSIRSTTFWQKFYTAYSTEIKARYVELKAKGILTVDNVYRHADRINKTFGINLYKKEQAAWPGIPSNSTIYASFPQLYDWTAKRITWMDQQYS